MTILYLSSLVRSSSLGLADYLYKNICHPIGPVLMSGHIHTAACLSNIDLSNFSSALNLYHPREAFVRLLLTMYNMDLTYESYSSIFNYFSNGSSALLSDRLIRSIVSTSSLVIDPSFSHSLYPKLLYNLSDVRVNMRLLVVWRNPICFCSDLMNGIYGLDCIIHLLRTSSFRSLPIDPLRVWLHFVRTNLLLLSSDKTVFTHRTSVKRESISLDVSPSFLSSLGLKCLTHPLQSNITESYGLLGDCPYSGDPSYYLASTHSDPLIVPLRELYRYSKSPVVVSSVAKLATVLGYTICND